MKSKMASFFIGLIMVMAIFPPIIQNVGEPSSSSTSSSSGGLADSPWPMFRQNLNHTGLSPYDTSGNDGQLKWKYTTGYIILSSSTIGSDGTIYVGCYDNKLYAFNSDGTLKWSYTTGWFVQSSPAIGSDGTIYVGSWDDKLHAINPDGTIKWSYTTGGHVHSSPAIASDGTIYVGSYDDKLHAINPDGTLNWSFAIGGHVHSSPAIASDGTIYFGLSTRDPRFYALNPDGTEKWNFMTGGGIISSPAIASDGTIYFGSWDNILYAINPDGTEKWSFVTGGEVYSSPAIGSDGTIYVGSYDNKLYAINPDGTEKWNFTTGDIVRSSPAIGSDGTIYVGSIDNKLYAFNPDGTLKWSYTTSDDVHSSPAIGSDGMIYVCSYNGILYAIGSPTPNLDVDVTSHFSTLNSAAQSAITVHVKDGTTPVQGATVNLVSNNGEMFSPQSGITDANGNFKSIFNAPTVTTQTICRITTQASKTGYNDGSGYVDVTLNPIPWPMFQQNLNHTGLSPYDTSSNPGKLKWSFTTGGSVDSSPTIGPNNTIYVGSDDNKLYAINPNGTEKWNFTTGAHVNSSPSIGSDGTIYVGSWDKKLYALYPDGTEKWSFTTGADVESSPSIGADGTIYVGSGDKKLYAINPDGTEKWSFMTGWDVWSSPAIGVDGTIYVGSEDNKLYAINPDGTEKWYFNTGRWVWSSPTIGFDGTIYVGSKDYKLYAINPDGTEKLSFTTGGSVTSSPAIGFDGTIYVGSHDDKLYAFNPDGTEKWNFTTYGNVYSSPAIGSDGTIYVGSYDDYVYAINSDGTEKWRFNNGFGTQSSPTIGSDGTIYIGSRDDNLYAIGALTQTQPPIADAGSDRTINEGDTVYLDGSASYPDPYNTTYDCTFRIPPDVIEITSIYTTGHGGRSYLIRNGGILISGGGGNKYFVERGGSVVTDGGGCFVYLKTGASFDAPKSGSHRIWYEPGANIIDPGNFPTLILCKKMKFEGYDPEHYMVSYEWDFESDGVYDYQETPCNASDGNFDGKTSHIYGDNGVYLVTMRVTDDMGLKDTDTCNVNVKNFYPAINSITIPSGNEGSQIIFSATTTDRGSDDLTFTWDWGDGTSSTITTYYNHGGSPDPFPSPGGTYPFTATNTVMHTYGDNGVYTIKLTLEDDDGGTVFKRKEVTVHNVVSTVTLVIEQSGDEGSQLTFTAEATDPGSDDLEFTWEFEYGPTLENIYYNDGVSPEPIFDPSTNELKSPLGTYPINISDTVTHTYGDDYDYTLILRVTDDDGGTSTYTTTIEVDNLAPSIKEVILLSDIIEGSQATFHARATDQGSDDLTFTWEFEHGPTITHTYYNDGSGPDPYPSPEGTYPFSATDLVSHTYGDNGVFQVTLTVEDDDGGSTTYITNITVNNVAPTIESVEAYMHVNFTLRVAGEKWHSVNITLYEDDAEIWSAGVTRQPGSPDEQAATLSGYSINFGCTYRAVVNYLPNDPRVNGNVWGGNPVWVILEFQDGTSERLHHTFNVRQSDWDSDHWNHIDPWEVDLTEIIYRHNITFQATASDPGSDDLIFDWDFGDGGIKGTNTYFNNGMSPDPYPSPEVNPMNVTDIVTHAYGASGNYTVTLIVTDDDGGITSTSLVITIPRIS